MKNEPTTKIKQSWEAFSLEKDNKVWGRGMKCLAKLLAVVTTCDFTNEFQAIAPTSTSNRVCAALTTCTANEYEPVAPTSTSNRVCAALNAPAWLGAGLWLAPLVRSQPY